MDLERERGITIAASGSDELAIKMVSRTF